MNDLEWMPLSQYINTEFKGNLKAFHMTHPEICAKKPTLKGIVERGEHYVIDGNIVLRVGTAKPCEVNIGSIAFKYLNRVRRNGANIDDIEELIIDNATSAERYGVDEIRYEFKDGSAIYQRALLNEFYMVKL